MFKVIIWKEKQIYYKIESLRKKYSDDNLKYIIKLNFLLTT